MHTYQHPHTHTLPLQAFLGWRLARISNKVLSRRQEILEKSNNVMTILITFTVGAQLHICRASGPRWPRREETIFTPGIQRLLTDVITLPMAPSFFFFFSFSLSLFYFKTLPKRINKQNTKVYVFGKLREEALVALGEREEKGCVISEWWKPWLI